MEVDDPSARIILRGIKEGSNFHLVYMQDHPSTFVSGAVAKQDGG